MSRKALFFDIDGTLLSEVNGQLPDSAVKALEAVRAKGHLVFVNTGRAPAMVQELQNVIKADGWLCGCGTYVEAEGREIYHREMSEQQRRYVCRAMEEADVDGILEGPLGCYMGSPDSRIEAGRNIRLGLAEIILSFDWNRECGPVEKFCFIADEKSDLDGLIQKLEPEIQVIDRGGYFYECVPAGHSKATAIDMILKEYGMALEDAVVFGDSSNDLLMFEHVPNAVLMGKHDKVLAPYASFVPMTVEEDGIAYALEMLGLL